MQLIDYANSRYTIRQNLVEAQRLAWRRVAAPGAWLDGRRRVAVAAEVRNAATCGLCNQRKAALSPFAVEGTHVGLGKMSPVEIDVVHRIVTDSGRLSEDWVKECLAAGLSEDEFVEILSIICIVMMVDVFAFGVGVDAFPLPEPEDGEPTKYSSPSARDHDAWIKYVQPGDEVPDDGDLYEPPFSPPIITALSLVPDAKRAYWELADQLYLPSSYIGRPDIDVDIRAINRPQIEVVATRVSSLHQCLY